MVIIKQLSEEDVKEAIFLLFRLRETTSERVITRNEIEERTDKYLIRITEKVVKFNDQTAISPEQKQIR